MNYLAHAFLSKGHSTLLAGNYLADYISKSESDQLPDPLYPGVQLHRLIDSFTDGHDAVRSCTKLLHPTVHKYAPVVVDIYFDFLLQQHWHVFCDQSIEDFRSDTYAMLQQEVLIPIQYRDRMGRMIDDDWLGRNADYEGLAGTYAYVQQRARFSPDFSGLVDVLKEHETQLSSYFRHFFPDVINEVDRWIDALYQDNERPKEAQ